MGDEDQGTEPQPQQEVTPAVETEKPTDPRVKPIATGPEFKNLPKKGRERLARAEKSNQKPKAGEPKSRSSDGGDSGKG